MLFSCKHFSTSSTCVTASNPLFFFLYFFFSSQTEAEPAGEALSTRGRPPSLLRVRDSGPAGQAEPERSASGSGKGQPGADQEVSVIRSHARTHAHTCSGNGSLTGPNLLLPALNCCDLLFPYRCKQLDKALAEATFRIQELEGINGSLEEKLVTFPQNFFLDLRRIVTTCL